MDFLKFYKNAGRTGRAIFTPGHGEEGRGSGELGGRISNTNDYFSSYPRSTAVTF
jgi:hypothetical protein